MCVCLSVADATYDDCGVATRHNIGGKNAPAYAFQSSNSVLLLVELAFEFVMHRVVAGLTVESSQVSNKTDFLLKVSFPLKFIQNLA